MFVPNPETVKLSFSSSYTHCWIMMIIYIYFRDIITLRKEIYICVDHTNLQILSVHRTLGTSISCLIILLHVYHNASGCTEHLFLLYKYIIMACWKYRFFDRDYVNMSIKTDIYVSHVFSERLYIQISIIYFVYYENIYNIFHFEFWITIY